jgi:GMP synthase PP-ATPase subunit
MYIKKEKKFFTELRGAYPKRNKENICRQFANIIKRKKKKKEKEYMHGRCVNSGHVNNCS